MPQQNNLKCLSLARFHASLTFEGKAKNDAPRPYPQMLDSPVNCRLVTNTLAYFVAPSVTKEKSFVTSTTAPEQA